jgi:hypothetical protein
MKKEQNGRKTEALTANMKQFKRIVVISGVGVVLILTELFCIPMIMPKRIIFTQVMHGDLISPPAKTNSAITANISSPKQTPTYVSMPSDGIGHGTIATGGPRAWAGANVKTPEPDFGTPEIIDGDYLQIGFNRLAAFQIKVIYQIIDPVRLTAVQKLNRPIPDFIKLLDSRKVALRGFMLPLKWENGSVKDFLLMRSRAFCCFGKTLEINELAYVHMDGAGVKSLMDQPLTVYGTFHVGEIVQHGRLNGIYSLDATKMDGPDTN